MVIILAIILYLKLRCVNLDSMPGANIYNIYTVIGNKRVSLVPICRSLISIVEYIIGF